MTNHVYCFRRIYFPFTRFVRRKGKAEKKKYIVDRGVSSKKSMKIHARFALKITSNVCTWRPLKTLPPPPLGVFVLIRGLCTLHFDSVAGFLRILIVIKENMLKM